MTFKELITESKKIEKTSNSNIKNLFFELLIYNSKKDKNWIYNHQEEVINFNWSKYYKQLKKIYIHKYPVNYITKTKSFYNSDFTVNKNTLIPRDETNIIIDIVKDIWTEYYKNKMINIFDIGTGCGNIALTLAKIIQPSCIWASDINNKTLRIAKLNSKKLGINHLSFLLGDLLGPYIKKELHCDILVSNPPYIAYNDHNIAYSVKKFEPKQALFAKNNGLYFYQQLLKKSILVIKKIGFLILEIGFNQKEDIINILKEYNNLIDYYIFKQDWNKKDRFLIIKICHKIKKKNE